MLEASLGLRTTGYTSGLRSAEAATKQFKQKTERDMQDVRNSLGGRVGGFFGDLISGRGGAIAGGGAIAALGLWLNRGAQAAGNLQDKVDMLGVSAERLQAINDVLADAGVAPEVAEQSLVNLNSKMIEAIDGSDELRQRFKNLGVSLDDLVGNGEAPDEIFLRLADGFQKAADKGRAMKDVVELLGKPGKKITGAFAAGAGPFREAEEGFNISGKEAEATDRWLDRLAKLKRKTLDVLPGKFVGAAAQVSDVLFAPDQWKKNLMGQNGLKAMQSEFAKLTPDEKRRVGMGISPEQAKAMSRTRFRPFSKGELEEQAQSHENIHQQQDIESAANTEMDQTIRRWVQRSSTRAAAMQLRAKIKDKVQAIQGRDAAGRAVGRAELADLMTERLDQLKARNLMTPDERRESDRQARREQQAAKKAQRQLAREAGIPQKEIDKMAKGDGTKEAVEKGNGFLDQLVQAVSRLGTIKP